MKYDFLGVIVFGIVLLIGVAVIAAFITVGIFLIRALSRYVKSGNVRKEKSIPVIMLSAKSEAS